VRSWLGVLAALLHVLAAVLHVPSAPASSARSAHVHASLVAAASASGSSVARDPSARASIVVDRGGAASGGGNDGDDRSSPFAFVPSSALSLPIRDARAATFTPSVSSSPRAAPRSSASARGPPRSV